MTSSIGSKPKAPPTLRFDAKQHRYWLDDREVPSVTTVLKGVGIIDPSKYAGGDAALRGTYVAEATALLDRGELDEGTMDERLAGYVRAWKAFLGDNHVETLLIEERVWHTHYMYAGTLDRTAEFQDGHWLLDIKTGGRERWHAIQTAAYLRAVQQGPCPYRRAAIYLKCDGTYKLDRHDSSDDWDVFLSALNVHNWKGKR